MKEIQKSIKETEDIFANVVCGILGIEPENINGRIRMSWGSNIDNASMSAPNLKTTEDICYIHVTPEDNAYNRQRNKDFIYEGGENMISFDEHTDVYNVLFVNYGSNAYDNARAIRNGLYSDRIRRFLRFSNMPLVTDTPAIRRVPELVSGNWVNRVDVSATFNQYVRLVEEIKTIEQIGVIPVTDEGGNGNEQGGENGNKKGLGDDNQEGIGAEGERGVFIVTPNGYKTILDGVRKE